MRVTLGPLLKVIVFVLTMTFLITMIGVVFSRMRLQPSNTYDAVFADASGLVAGSDVRGNGVAIGTVKSLELHDGGGVTVQFTVAKTVDLDSATTARIRYANLTGDRYLDLAPGHDKDATELPPGGTIPMAQTQAALDLDRFFQGFDPLMQALNPDEVNQLAQNIIEVTQGQAGSVESMLANVGSFTSRLAERDQIIGDTINDLAAALALMDEHRGDFDDLIVGLSDLMRGFAKDRRVIGASLASINDAAADTGDLIARIRPDLKANIDQMGSVAKDLNDNADEISKVLDVYPTLLSKLSRLGAYGSFFNFYLCGVRVRLDLPGEDLDVYTPWFQDHAGRCAGKAQ
jgi:phospholipid/cholesterol/gamma-HCH transport system substrate-binding protein